eukprot:SAG31_NODE_3640_length_4033_cov_4.161413_2_plen_153_part_00
MLLPGGSPAAAAALSAAAAAAAGEGDRVLSGRMKTNRAQAPSQAKSENERNREMGRADNSSTKPFAGNTSKNEPRREMKSMRLDGDKEMELVWREQALRHALDHAPVLPVLYPRDTACTVDRAIAVATAWRDAGIRSMQVDSRLHAPILVVE